MSDRGLREAELIILNAPFEERGWERAVTGIAAATGSHAAQLLGLGGPLLLPLNIFVGPPASFRHYIERAEMHGPCNWRVGTATVAMSIQHEPQYDAYRRTHQTSDYDDAASEMDIPYGCQSALMLDHNGLIGLALLRGRRDGRCTAETLDRFARLRHHVARSVRVQLALDGEAAELMVGDLAPLHGATLLLDRHGSLAALTPAAEEALGEKGPLRLCGLAVRLREPQEDRPFQQALARLLASDGISGPLVHQARVGRSTHQPEGAWRLFITRLPHRPHGLGFDPHLALTVKAAA